MSSTESMDFIEDVENTDFMKDREDIDEIEYTDYMDKMEDADEIKGLEMEDMEDVEDEDMKDIKDMEDIDEIRDTEVSKHAEDIVVAGSSKMLVKISPKTSNSKNKPSLVWEYIEKIIVENKVVKKKCKLCGKKYSPPHPQEF
ncbi:21705_t:CDS:1 [Dentiscutata erythropus]|uniref:21705_t:CDS:1 n=1 Tax=Dentiscutata erythropus TaxID=1348616 RepID=A0A9N9A584_9GLOM|nr:21705_t:CDS:1 [Dentiscutata erythropus]